MKEDEQRLGKTDIESRLAAALERNAELLQLNADLRTRVAEGKYIDSGFGALTRSGVVGVVVVTSEGTVLEANDAFLAVARAYPRRH